MSATTDPSLPSSIASHFRSLERRIRELELRRSPALAAALDTLQAFRAYAGGTELLVDRIRVSTSEDATSSDGTGGIQVGPDGALNLGIDANEIQARNNSASSDLFVNLEGGRVNVGPGGNIFQSESQIEVDTVSARNGGPLLVAAGESDGVARPALQGITQEFLWLVAEGGPVLVRSPDNWGSGWAGRIQYQPMPTDWVNVTFENSWFNYGSSFQSVQYRRHGDVVELRGLARKTGAGSANETIFTLPADLRPAANHIFAAMTSGLSTGEPAQRVNVYASGIVGVVNAPAAGTNWVSLSGITFPVGS